VRLHQARQVANPVDLSLDVLGWSIEYDRGNPQGRLAEILERMQTERFSYMVVNLPFNKTDIVPVFDLAIEQRHPELHWMLFGSKPRRMPEADWVRIKEITGVTQFQENELKSLRSAAAGSPPVPE
jgi:hypothetical protein